MSRTTRRGSTPATAVTHSVWTGRLVFSAGIALLAVVLSIFFAPSSAASRYRELRVWQSNPSACPTGTAENGFCFPNSEAACIAQGGQWLLLGGSTGYGCTRVAPDAGQPCSDGTQCTSAHCLGTLTVSIRQQLQLQASKGVPTQGVCAGFLRVFSCFAAVTNGRIYELTCRQ